MTFTRKTLALIATALLTANTLFVQPTCAITIKQEEDLSREFLKIVRSRFKLIEDPELLDYLNQVSNRVVAVLPTQPFKYHFYIIDDDVYNAFATPAGHIFINSGLIEAMETEAELAGIMAHEISHVACRHISDKIELQKKLSIATLAGVAAGIFLGASGSPEAANALARGAMATGQSVSLAYSREDERQADEIGLKYLTKAGYDGRGLLRILKKIRSKQWFGANQIPTYMMTHPATEDRIAYIDTWLENHAAPRRHASDYAFKRARARMLAFYGDEDTVLRQFRDDVGSNPNDPLAHYGYGLVLTRTGDYKQAAAHFKSALARKALDPYLLKELGRSLYLDGQYAEALPILESAASMPSTRSEGLLYLGRTHSALGHFQEATRSFESILGEDPKHTQALYFIAQAYGRQDKQAESHFYLGKYYMQKRYAENAIFHFKKAREGTTDPVKLKEIDALLRKADRNLSSKPSRTDSPRSSRRSRHLINFDQSAKTAW